jgi:hypothetical protein
MFTVGYWVIPLLISAFFAFMLFRPIPSDAKGGYFDGLNYIFRLLWLIPILITWLIYFMIRSFSA